MCRNLPPDNNIVSNYLGRIDFNPDASWMHVNAYNM